MSVTYSLTTMSLKFSTNCEACGQLFRFESNDPADLDSSRWPTRCADCRTRATDAGTKGAVEGSTLRLGDIVSLADEDQSAYVVIAVNGDYTKARLVYCGSQRWYVPEWVETSKIVKPAAENKNTRRARRWLDKAGFEPDGWRRIVVGRYGSEFRVEVDHISLQRSDVP